MSGKWGYASKGGRPPFTDIRSGDSINSDDLTGIVMNRADYTLDVLEIPRAGDEETRQMLEYKIRSLHPSPDPTPFDWIIIGRGRVLKVAVIILSGTLFSRYRQLADGRPLTILYQWLHFPLQNGSSFQYRTDSFGEAFFFTDSILHRINKDDDGQSDGIEAFLKQKKPVPLFSNKKKQTVIKHQTLNWLLLVAAAFSFFFYLWWDVNKTRTAVDSAKREYNRLIQDKNRLLALDSDIADLQQQVETLRQQQKSDIYPRISALFLYLQPGSIVDDLEITETGFRIRIRSDNPLSVIEAYHNSSYFSNVSSSSIQGIDGTDQKIFSITGDFNG